MQAYIDQIGDLLLANDGPLRRSKESDEARTLARARTLTVLRRLEGERKASVLQFLYESNLIAPELPVLDLSEANLSGADLGGAVMIRANLRRAAIRGACLGGTNLSGAVEWTETQLSSAESLKGATMPDGQKYEDWIKVREATG